MSIDWSKAPEWANAVISSKDGQEFYVSQFGGISARQRVGYCEVDSDHRADMIAPHDWSLVATRRAPWTGEGLPTVGTVCEYRVGDGPWFECEIRYVTKPYQDCPIEVVMFPPHLKGEQTAVVGTSCGEVSFRPIRTPEQVAAEDRRKACEELLSDCYQDANAFALVQAGRLYDAGWRKQVTP
jgi:hypothetical protein